MADGQEKSHPPVVVDQQETPLEKHETEPLKGKMSIAPSVVSNKPDAKTHHVSVHQSEHRSEAIELTTLQMEKKRGVIIPSSHPIPADVKSVHSSDSRLDQDKKPPKGDGKEIDENGCKQKNSKIDEKKSEWDATLQVAEMKEVSWHKRGVEENELFQEVDLPSTSLTLVRKASVGPCRTFASVGGPSGISINIPRKSSKCINKVSGINVTISKKSLAASLPPKFKEQDDVTSDAENTEKNIKGQQKSGNFRFLKCLRALFGKK
ncbi:uncharacterized protein LOC121733275 [Aricia agestis]|uniref:uncharacterized protein LOC121733275 n=1 Tax=Aricia agestis TaxID=91739 RepID=UPI001C20B799|nr:uncharacterized protein LOC121733275 [Aricia agestis]